LDGLTPQIGDNQSVEELLALPVTRAVSPLSWLIPGFNVLFDLATNALGNRYRCVAGLSFPWVLPAFNFEE
jgi:hypothetical protein